MDHMFVEILKEARELVKTEDTWTQGIAWRDEKGDYISWGDILKGEVPVKFCIGGAVEYVCHKKDITTRQYHELAVQLREFEVARGSFTLTWINDYQGYGAAIKELDTLIKEFEEKYNKKED